MLTFNLLNIRKQELTLYIYMYIAYTIIIEVLNIDLHTCTCISPTCIQCLYGLLVKMAFNI